MKRYNIIITTFLIVTLMQNVACSNDMTSDSSLVPTTSVILKIQSHFATRAYLERDEAGLVTIARWNDGEKIKLFVSQDGSIIDLGEVPLQGISDDGQTAQIDIRMPGQIDITREFNLYGMSHYFDAKISKDATGKSIITGTFSYKERYEWTGSVKRDKVPWCFETTVKQNTATIEVQQLAAYEFIHLINATDTRPQAYLKKIEADECWFYNTFNLQMPGSIVTGSDASFIEDEFRYQNDWQETISTFTFYLPNGKRPKNVRFHFTINKQDYVTPARSANIDILPGHAYHYWLKWDGTNLTYDHDGETGEQLVNELRFDPTELELVEDGGYGYETTGREQFYTFESSNPDVATGVIDNSWDDPCVEISGHSIGTAVVTITDTETGKKSQIKVTVNEKTIYSAFPEVGKTDEVIMKNESGVYEAYSDDTSIATCMVSGNKIIVTGVKLGNTIIHVTEKTSSKQYSIEVYVIEQGGMPNPDSGDDGELDDVPGYEL